MISGIRKLVELVIKLLGYKCVCLQPDEYDKLVKEVSDAVAKLEEWLKKAESGELGAEKPS